MNQDELGKAMLDVTKQRFTDFTARKIEKEEAKKRKAETQAGNVDDMAIEDDKAEDAEVAEARRRASELAKTGDSANVCFKERVKHVTAVHTARQVITHVNNMLENLQDDHMLTRVGLKAYKDLQAKVEKALSSATIALYTLGVGNAYPRK